MYRSPEPEFPRLRWLVVVFPVVSWSGVLDRVPAICVSMDVVALDSVTLGQRRGHSLLRASLSETAYQVALGIHVGIGNSDEGNGMVVLGALTMSGMLLTCTDQGPLRDRKTSAVLAALPGADPFWLQYLLLPTEGG